MINNKKEKAYLGRYCFVLSILGLCALGLSWRMLDLTVLNRAFLQKQGDARTVRIIDIPAYRGMIRDRQGQPLAISTQVDSLWINPKVFDLKYPEVKKLEKDLDISQKKLNDLLVKNKKKEFVYLKRGVSPDTTARILDLKIPGLYSKRNFHRYYPEGEVIAHILGFTNIDDNGQEGLELAYDDWLKGRTGKKKIIRDNRGQVAEDLETLVDPIAGNDLILSIDRRIQYIAYRELKSAIALQKAKSGSVAILNAKTGEVLAMVNQPSYNPNSARRYNDGRNRNRAVTDLFEPGSVMKPFTLANVLKSKKYTKDSVIDTRPGYFYVEGKRIRDEHYSGLMTMTEILRRSSNVGIAKLILDVPGDDFIDFVSSLGFGQTTALHFPGESAGVISIRSAKQSFMLATLGFGYGISVTPIQLAQAYLIFANKGKLLPVSLQKIEHPPEGKQVLSPKIAEDVLGMLKSVVNDKGGTGASAQVVGYTVAGKTGTARIAGRHGYDQDRHISTFVGIVPADDPALVIAVIIQDPQAGEYLASAVAAPVFSKIATSALHVLNIPREQRNQRFPLTPRDGGF